MSPGEKVDILVNELTITHNYYDPEDADRDINVVFPIEQLKELESEEVIGEIAPRHFSFMGHVLGRHMATFINQTGPEAARRLGEDGVDVVFLTPA
jgi:D-proline reductase (dithiol) PrdB